MPYALDTYTGDGTKTDFEVTFPYIQRDQVRVFQDTTELTVVTDGTPAAGQYKWEDNDTILVGTPPPSGTPLKVLRDTPKGDQIVDWVNGSYIVAADLNTSDLQWLYSIQELIDRVNEIDGTVIGEAVKSVTGTEPIQIDNSNPQTPVVSIDETDTTGDPNDLTSDTRVMSEAAIDKAFKQYVGTNPTTGQKVGQIRIDNTGATASLFYWNGTAWVQVSSKGDKGDKGDPGPAPGLQDPAATASTVPLNGDGTLGTATAQVLQDPASKDLKFLFGIPQGLTGEKGQDGADSTVPGPPPGLQSTAAVANNVANNPDGSIGQATAAVAADSSGDLQFTFGIPVGQRGEPGLPGPPGDGVNYMGKIDATSAPEPATKRNGDFYINTATGASTWTGLSTVSVNDRLVWNNNTSVWDVITPPPATGVDLSYTPAPGKGTVVNSAGADADLPAADATNAGLMLPAQYTKLNGIEAGAEVNPDLSTYLQSGDNVSELTNDAGYITSADIPPQTTPGLQEVLDTGNTSTTDLWVGDGGQTVKLLAGGTVDASNSMQVGTGFGGGSATGITLSGTGLFSLIKRANNSNDLINATVADGVNDNREFKVDSLANVITSAQVTSGSGSGSSFVGVQLRPAGNLTIGNENGTNLIFAESRYSATQSFTVDADCKIKCNGYRIDLLATLP